MIAITSNGTVKLVQAIGNVITHTHKKTTTIKHGGLFSSVDSIRIAPMKL